MLSIISVLLKNEAVETEYARGLAQETFNYHLLAVVQSGTFWGFHKISEYYTADKQCNLLSLDECVCFKLMFPSVHNPPPPLR